MAVRLGVCLGGVSIEVDAETAKQAISGLEEAIRQVEKSELIFIIEDDNFEEGEPEKPAKGVEKPAKEDKKPVKDKAPTAEKDDQVPDLGSKKDKK